MDSKDKDDSIIIRSDIVDPINFFDYKENCYNPKYFEEDAETINNIYLQDNYKCQRDRDQELTEFLQNASFAEKERKLASNFKDWKVLTSTDLIPNVDVVNLGLVHDNVPGVSGVDIPDVVGPVSCEDVAIIDKDYVELCLVSDDNTSCDSNLGVEDEYVGICLIDDDIVVDDEEDSTEQELVTSYQLPPKDCDFIDYNCVNKISSEMINKVIVKRKKIPFSLVRKAELYFTNECEKLILEGIHDKEGNALSVDHPLHPLSQSDPIPLHLLNRKTVPGYVLAKPKAGQDTGRDVVKIKTNQEMKCNNVKDQSVVEGPQNFNYLESVLTSYIDEEEHLVKEDYDDLLQDVLNKKIEMLNEPDETEKSETQKTVEQVNFIKNSGLSALCSTSDKKNILAKPNITIAEPKFNPVQFSSSKPVFNLLNISDKMDNIVNKVNRISEVLDEKYSDHDMMCGEYGQVDIMLNDYNSELSVFAIDHSDVKKSTQVREFYRNTLAINVSISAKIVPAELDTGSAFCIIGLKTIEQIDRDWQSKFKRSDFTVPLKGVTGNNLNVIGNYEVPAKFPIIGNRNLQVKVIANQDIFLIGRDFLTSNNVSIKFSPNKYTVSFGRSLTNITIERNETVDFNEGISNVEFDVSNEKILPGNYIASLVNDPLGDRLIAQMPDQIVNISKRKKFNLSLFAFNSISASHLHKITINLERINNNEEQITGCTEIDMEDLQKYSNMIPTSVSSISEIPTKVRYLYDSCDKDFFPESYRESMASVSKTDSKISNNICIECITNPQFVKLSIPELTFLHKGHKKIQFGSKECIDFISALREKRKDEDAKRQEMINKVNISRESEDLDFQMDDTNKNFEHLESPDSTDLIPGEIGVPKYKTDELILEAVMSKLEGLPVEVQDILKGPLMRNERMSSCPWDIPAVKGEALHYEVKNLPKSTKIYPVKREDIKAMYSTIQFLLYYRIIDRAPVNASFGSPTFLIRRKATATESSRSPRLLLDARQANMAVLGSKSSAMLSCYDQLRAMCSGTKFISSLDLSNMFYSLKNSEEVIESGAVNFTTPFGVFRLLRSIQGGALSPSFANSIIMKRLHLDSQDIPNYLDTTFSFYDDINLASAEHYTMIEHAYHLADLLNRIHKIGFMINMQKSKLCVNLQTDSIELLGLKISKNVIQATQKRRDDVLAQLITPANKTALQRLIGLLNYMRNLMQADDLKHLNILSTKLKSNKLSWDDEGERSLAHLRLSLKNREFCLHVPDGQCLPLLFADSSEHSAAGVLFFLKIENIEDVINYPDEKSIPVNKLLRAHNEKFKIATTPLTHEHTNILEFACSVFYHYHDSDIKRNAHVIQLIVDSLIRLTPQVNYKINYTDEMNIDNSYRDFCRSVDSNNVDDKYDGGNDLILSGLSFAMRRQILIVILSDDYQMSTPFIRLTGDSELSPMLICYRNGTFSLLALMRDDYGLKKYSKKTLEDLTSSEILKIYRQADKENKLFFGGCYSFSLPESYKHVAIYLKELLALSSSLSYWSTYLKMSRSFVFVDSSTVLYGLKSVKAKGLGKLHRIGISLSNGFPLVRIFLIPSKHNPADHYSRVNAGEPDTNTDHTSMCMTEFVNSFASSDEIDDEKMNILAQGNPNFDKHLHDAVNIIGEEDIKSFLNPPPTYESIRRITNLYYRDGIENCELVNGYLVTKAGMIFLPPELWLSFVLHVHSIHHHPGVEGTFKILLNEFYFTNRSKMRDFIGEIIKSCIACGEAKASFYKGYCHQNTYGSEIMNSISADIIESSKFFSPQANLPIHSCLGLICNVSRYAEVFYLSTGSTNEIVMAFLSFFSKNRIPRYIYADNGSNIRSKKVYSLFHLLGIQFVRSSPYASKARGKIENYFKALRNASRVFNSLYPTTNELLSFMYFIRVHNNLKLPIANIDVTPSFLANFPFSSSICKQDYSSAITSNFSKRLRAVNSTTLQEEHIDMAKLYDEAVECIQKMARDKNDKVNKNKTPHSFKEGEYVIARNFSRVKKSERLYNRDVLRIAEVNGSLLVCQSVVTGLLIQRHILHVKRINVLSNRNINSEVQRLFGLFTTDYIDQLVKQYKRETLKPSKVEVEGVKTRSKAREEEEMIQEAVNIDPPLDDFEEEVGFE